MKKQNKSLKKKAFSLIELAVVVVVAGVLIVGITKVNSLIEISETRATEMAYDPYKDLPTKGLYTWLSAQSTTKLGDVSDGDAVTIWSPTGGSNKSNAIAAGDVIYRKSGISGNPSLEFTGSNFDLDAADLLGSEHTIIMVTKPSDVIGSRVLFSFGNIGGSNGHDYTNHEIYYSKSSNSIPRIYANGSGEVDYDIPNIVTYVVSSSGIALYLNSSTNSFGEIYGSYTARV